MADEPLLSAEDYITTLRRFGWPDYLVFTCMLLSCIFVGIYFGYYKVSVSTQDFLVGGRSMRTIPVGFSLVATFISGISLLGIPTEIYMYGMQYVYIGVAVLTVALIFQYVYLPVFHNMKLTSSYEYLEKRFNRPNRMFASFLFLTGVVTWLPIVIYVPALALNQVTGVNVHLITPCVCVICMFYTTVGGLRAVVWADVIQTFIMVGALILIVFKGTANAGGFFMVWQRSLNSTRIEPPNFEWSLESRHTVWSLFIGGFSYWLQEGCLNQNMMQRYLSLPSLKTANRALWIFAFGIVFITTTCAYIGMVIYATYHKCDPLTTKLAREKDQLLPLLVMEILGDYPGLPGIFMAGIFSAALSSLSTAMNASAAIVLEDFCKTLVKKDISEKSANVLIKVTVIITGCLCVALVYIVEKMGTVLQFTMTVSTIAGGPSLALTTMGLLFPWVNSKGALTGGITGMCFMSWLLFKAQMALTSGELVFPNKGFSIEDCHYHFTLSQTSFNNATFLQNDDESFMLHKISYLWYTLLGCLVSMVVGIAISFVTTPNDPRDVEPNLLAPFVRRLIKPRSYPNQPSDGIIFAYVNDNDQNTKPSEAS